jgi:hypothetical protein
MKFIFKYLALFFLLSSCTNSLKQALGMTKADSPDEFLVEKRNPLTVPPSYDLLPPDSSTASAAVVGDLTTEKKSIQDILNKNLKNDSASNANSYNASTNNSENSAEKSVLNNLK